MIEELGFFTLKDPDSSTRLDLMIKVDYGNPYDLPCKFCTRISQFCM